jgi:hypothetical protein
MKRAKKFDKYLKRMNQVIDGTNKKIPHTPVPSYPLMAV